MNANKKANYLSCASSLLFLILCSLSSDALCLPVSEVTVDRDQNLPVANETRIVFDYLPRDDCSCSIVPCICGNNGFYIKGASDRIMHNWSRSPAKTPRSVKVRFRIHKDGTLSDLRLVRGGDINENKSALNAVTSAAPFFKLPEGAPKFVDVEYSFPKTTPLRFQRERSHSAMAADAIAPYLLILQDKIRDSWCQSPSAELKDFTVVEFRMHADGSLTDQRVMQGSNFANADSLALKTVESASPLDLPLGLPANVWVQVTFDPSIRMAWISEAFIKD